MLLKFLENAGDPLDTPRALRIKETISVIAISLLHLYRLCLVLQSKLVGTSGKQEEEQDIKTMPVCRSTYDHFECYAAQALLDLHSSSSGTKHDNSTGNENVDATELVYNSDPVGDKSAPKKKILYRYNLNTITTDVATQTEGESSKINELQLALSQRDETIQNLREQIEALADVKGPVGSVPDDTNREDCQKMTTDDSSHDATTEPNMEQSPNTDHTYASRNLKSTADEMVPIGSGKVSIPAKVLNTIDWSSHKKATRKLLETVFTRRILATHSLSGKPSPAFPSKKTKRRLNPMLVDDIVKTVARRCRIAESIVRLTITTKCADESKMLRDREKKRTKHKTTGNRENIPPDSDCDELSS
ncbi:hypothetical protein PYW08_013258 [Mythimna loreyi]|uniref:Uncharacterized protein n=1 Tax=Mythimna loreyi TaxID=667449 RepID=A0ACC2QF23_9NEOP|nr:hypothetical protein PYW08_013258 [Mythimna loreyi]